MDNKKIRQIVVIVGIVCSLLIVFSIVYKMGSSNGKKEQAKEIQKVVTDKINEEVKKQNDSMAKVKRQQETTVYVCRYQDNKTRLFKVYSVIHKSKDCPDMNTDNPDGSSKDYISRSYWDLVRIYPSTQFTFCSEWTKEEIEALEDKGQ